MKPGRTEPNSTLCWHPWTIALTVSDIGTTVAILLMISKIWRIIFSEYSSLERLRMYSQAAENLKRKHKEDSVKPCNNTVQYCTQNNCLLHIYRNLNCTLYNVYKARQKGVSRLNMHFKNTGRPNEQRQCTALNWPVTDCFSWQRFVNCITKPLQYVHTVRFWSLSLVFFYI